MCAQHTSDADWRCSDLDQNGLWRNSRYSELDWISDWRAMVHCYREQPAVVGVDLRNEPRAALGRSPTWGGAEPSLDWKRAAGSCAEELLKLNPNLLIFVEELNYSTDFGGVYTDPLQPSVAGRLVYSPHDYAWLHNGLSRYAELKTALGNKWGFLLVQGKPYAAPVWVSEGRNLLRQLFPATASTERASLPSLWTRRPRLAGFLLTLRWMRRARSECSHLSCG